MDRSLISTTNSSKQNSSANVKYAGFQDFIKKHLIRKNEGNPTKDITNTRIGSKDDKIYGGAYEISNTEYKLFLDLYSKDILGENKKEYLTEKQLTDDGPLLVDIDLRHDLDVDERQYTKEHIEDMIDIYLETLKEVYQLDSTCKFTIFVQQKPTVNQVQTKNCTKDGIHLLIGLKIDRVTQQMIREKVIPKVAEAWGDLKIINSWEDVFDKGITDGTVNWQLYGSRKPNHDRYKVTYIHEVEYDDTDQEFMRREIPLSSYDFVKDIYPLSVRNDSNPSFFLKSSFIKEHEEYKRIHQLGGAGKINNSVPRTIRDVSRHDDINMSSIKNPDELTMVLNNFLDSVSKSQLDYDLKDAYDYVMVLPTSFYESGSYSKWIRVGWCLKNISSRLLIVWLAFSAQSSTFQFSEIPELCDMWRKFDSRPQDGITKRSLYHWVKTEAPESYELIRHNSIDYHVEQTLRSGGKGKTDSRSSCGDFDLATVLYHMFKHDYVCTSVKGNLWMHYKNHRWYDLDSGTTLRKAISNQLRELYRSKAVQYMHKNESKRTRTDDDEEPVSEQDDVNLTIQQRILTICQRLSQTNDKNNIMREAKELFYDGTFLGKLDTNPYLLCCDNGVYDFKDKTFRNGIPEDNISMSTNINYVQLGPKHDKLKGEINDFMDKLFPEPELREYMWDHLASTLLGTSTNQTFNMYIGHGQNGKSVLVNLMEVTLGDYKGDVPLTLVTDKRGKVGGLAPEIVQLKGKRFAVMQEPSKGDQINEGIMKQLTSGKDPIQARAPYMLQTISFIPQFKLVVTCNVLMEIKSNDHGTWRRIRAVPFKSLFTDNPVEGDTEKPYQYKLDKSIDEKFDSWKEVFLSMLIQRADKTNGIVNDCDIVMQKSNEYRKSQDYLSEFVEDCIERSPNPNICVQKGELKGEFNRWYDINYGGRGPSTKDLHDYMDRCFGKNRGSKWFGIGIKYQDTTEDQEYDVIKNNTTDVNINGL